MIEVVNPADGSVVAAVETVTPEQVKDAYERARVAQVEWSRTPLSERVACLSRFRSLVTERRDELAATLTSEVGKPITQARNELDGVVPRIDFFVDHVAGALAEQVVFEDEVGGLREVISREPLGVVVNISAWNYPWFVGSNVFVPALLTGNAVLYKPSEFAALTGRAIAELLWEAGVPCDVFNVLLGGGDVGAAVLELPIDGVFFTGSYATGRRIAEAVAASLVPVQLELGGKDPVYVADDVDVASVAAAVADGAFYNTGQSCCSVERIYVHCAIYDEFVERFVDAVRGFVVGDPLDERSYIGPLTRAAQLKVLEAQVADAVAKGATVRIGGHRLEQPGNWFAPTVLTEVDHTMTVMVDESFGPIIGIQAVASDDEAVRLMNDTRYGLTAGVYTSDETRARAILAMIDVGSVYWNCCDRVSPRLPWSGRRHSGIGVTLSTLGLQAFTRPKAWHLRSG
ncbi:MAG: aldehyde dehydrogenase family protein [Acidimicrobiales bacterium]|nr:aldehyde dehydrogenase family protein [Acidimicrobiales bacterium]